MSIMDEETNYITDEKRKALIEELNMLKTVKRKEIIESIESAKALGDLSENAEYHQAREDQGKTEDRINQIEYILQSSVVVKNHHSSMVEIGTTVVVKKEGSKENITYSVVGTEEADMSKNKISNKSPLGEALFGKSKGDVIPVTTPKGLAKYTIIDIQ
jgi:transcription elongation factor GreA